MPFQPDSPIPVLAQVTDRDFELREQYVYVWLGNDEPTSFTVPRDFENRFDLTSIPGFMTWLVPKYGKHTLAVLLHDDLIEDQTPPDERAVYDTVFRDALGELEVPLLRRWTLWAGTNVGTRLKRSSWKRMLSMIWIAVIVLGSIVFWWNASSGIAEWQPIGTGAVGTIWFPIVVMLVAAVLLVPDPWPMGVIGPLAGLLLLPATVVVVLTIGAYLLVESAVLVVIRVLQRFNVGTDWSAPDPIVTPREVRSDRRHQYWGAVQQGESSPSQKSGH